MMKKMRLPEIVGETWFNSNPLKPKNLEGKAVLIDFWTYSCVNCQRTLPYLKKWWKNYKDRGFLLIGIHAPEFEFEKDPKNVGQAIKDLGVEWPVVLDNNHLNWDNFSNHYWPAKYLADKNGNIVYTHFGEGAYEETEKKIQELLKGSEKEMPLPPISASEHEHGQVCFIPTPETYCGYGRGRLSNPRSYQEDQVANYQKPEEIPNDSIALSGKFQATEEYVESKEEGATLFLRFRATEVNLVLHPVGSKAVVEVILDGKTLGEITIEKPTLYNLLKTKDLAEGVLGIRAKEGSFQAYAFTFSGCEAP